jgi:hypothetical protein
MPSDDSKTPSIEVGSLVVLHCANPREKHWGLLIKMDGLGVVLRGLDLASVEDWLVQERGGGDALIVPSTFFVPTHRVVRLDLDESGPVVSGYGDRFSRECGRDVRRALIEGTSGDNAN